MGVDVRQVDELVRVSVSAAGAAINEPGVIAIMYLEPAVAIEAGRRMADEAERMLREQATRSAATYG